MKKDLKTIILLITFAVLLFVLLEHFNVVLSTLSFIFSLFLPFIIGFCIAFVLNVLLKLLEDKLLKKVLTKHPKIKRAISLILSLVIVFGLVIFVLILIIPELKNAIAILIDNIPIYKEEIVILASKIGLPASTIEGILSSFSDLGGSIFNLFKNNTMEVASTTLGVTSSILSGFATFILAIVFAIYMLADKENLTRQAKRLTYLIVPKKKVEGVLRVGKIANETFNKFIAGQVMEAFIIGILCFIGMLLLGLPYASTISVLVGFTALIPVFGALIGTFIGAVLIFVVDPIGALIFIAYIIVLQQIEGNLIYPKVVGSSVGLPGIWVMLAVILGGSLFGLVGMLIGVPLFSVFYLLLKEYSDKRLKNVKID